MLSEAHKILELFNLKSNQQLTDNERLKMIEIILLNTYKEGKENGIKLAVNKYKAFSNEVLNEIK